VFLGVSWQGEFKNTQKFAPPAPPNQRHMLVVNREKEWGLKSIEALRSSLDFRGSIFFKMSESVGITGRLLSSGFCWPK
jgi:hypothetical protein